MVNRNHRNCFQQLDNSKGVLNLFSASGLSNWHYFWSDNDECVVGCFNFIFLSIFFLLAIVSNKILYLLRHLNQKTWGDYYEHTWYLICDFPTPAHSHFLCLHLCVFVPQPPSPTPILTASLLGRGQGTWPGGGINHYVVGRGAANWGCVQTEQNYSGTSGGHEVPLESSMCTQKHTNLETQKHQHHSTFKDRALPPRLANMVRINRRNIAEA